MLRDCWWKLSGRCKHQKQTAHSVPKWSASDNRTHSLLNDQHHQRNHLEVRLSFNCEPRHPLLLALLPVLAVGTATAAAARAKPSAVTAQPQLMLTSSTHAYTDMMRHECCMVCTAVCTAPGCSAVLHDAFKRRDPQLLPGNCMDAPLLNAHLGNIP
jgi:hypothetical protein